MTGLVLLIHTTFSISISAKSFVELGKSLLTEDGVQFLLSAKLNQDPLEQYFSKQRSLMGSAENPDVMTFGYNHMKLLVSGSSAVRASTRGNTTPEEVTNILSEPMKKKKRKK